MEYERWNVPKRSKNPSRITVPEHAHPVARFIFDQMNKQGITYLELENCSGVITQTVKAWRRENRVGIDTAEACLGVLGFSLLPVPNPERLSPELRADLSALADKHGIDCDLSVELIAACVGRQPHTVTPWNWGERRESRHTRNLPLRLRGTAQTAEAAQ